MARLIDNEIRRRLADELLFGKLMGGGEVEVAAASVEDEELTLNCSPHATTKETKAKKSPAEV